MAELVVLAGLVIVAVIVLNAVMNMLGIAITIVSWILAGYFARRIVGGKDRGPIVDGAMGLVGGIVGMIFLRVINLGFLQDIWLVGGVIGGTIGAVLLILVIRLVHDRDFAK